MQDLPEKRKQAPRRRRWQWFLAGLLLFGSMLIYDKWLRPPAVYTVILPTALFYTKLQDFEKQGSQDVQCFSFDMYNLAHPDIGADALDYQFSRNLQIILDNELQTDKYTSWGLMAYSAIKDGQSVYYGSPINACIVVTNLPEGLHTVIVKGSNGHGTDFTETWQFTKTRPLLPNWGG